MSPVNGGINHYEKINMKNLNQQYESIKNIQLQVTITPDKVACTFSDSQVKLRWVVLAVVVVVLVICGQTTIQFVN